MNTPSTKTTTLVLGASSNPDRYSYRAVVQLLDKNIPVVALGNRTGHIGSQPILTDPIPLDSVDTVTLYLNPTRQVPYYPYILSLHPRRLIFNPGSENTELAELARKEGIQVQEACTLVLLSIGRY
jgi:predicted CoA-binding protein